MYYVFFFGFFSGSCMWFLGWIINIHSDHILRNLREPGETGYKIPRGKAIIIRLTAPFMNWNKCYIEMD